MDTNVETTTTQRGRHTKTPAKYQQTGSLGAAAGGGGLLSSNQKLLPGITRTTPETTGGALPYPTLRSRVELAAPVRWRPLLLPPRGKEKAKPGWTPS